MSSLPSSRGATSDTEDGLLMKNDQEGKELLPSSEEEEDKPEDVIDEEPQPLDEDLYGVAITSLIRDLQRIFSKDKTTRVCLRATRATVTAALLIANITLQIYLITEFQQLVTRSFVHKIRTVYGHYERFMYDDMVRVTPNGFSRGDPGFFKPEKFKDLPESIGKDYICSIPLSQPFFLGALLSIWSLTVVQDVRTIQSHATLLVWRTKNIDSMAGMLVQREGEATCELEGLPLTMKALLAVFIFLPRLLLDLYLLWLGCRWLVATADFGDLLLNAIALEFILCLKDLVYNAVVPMRDRYETTTLLIRRNRPTHASWGHYLGAFLWLIVVVVWVTVYMLYLQAVLPDYQWDIATVCQAFIIESTSLVKVKEL